MTTNDTMGGYLTVEVSGQVVKHNAIKWRLAKNRHSNTDGTDWGWIEGSPGNVCWSDNGRFNRASAEQMVSLHNHWLEDQKPLSIKLIEARECRDATARRFERAKFAFEEARAELARCDAILENLAIFVGSP